MDVVNAGFEICYNVQNVVDDKNHIIIVTDVVSSACDQGQLVRISEKATETLGTAEEKQLKTFYNESKHVTIILLIKQINN